MWSVESHFGTNEYNNVAFQLAQIHQTLNAMDYPNGMMALLRGTGRVPYAFRLLPLKLN